MEHEEAIQSQAAERYVAHKLPPTERDAFEAHFFDCPECAEEVRWEQIFAANGRAAVRRPMEWPQPPPAPAPSVPATPPKLSWMPRWLPALPLSLATNCALAAAIVFLLVTPARKPAPAQWTEAQWTVDEYFAPGPARGADLHTLPGGTPVYQIRFPSIATSSYSYEVLDSQARRELSGSLAAPAAPDTNLRLTVSVGSLAPGVHTLIVHGLPSGEIASKSRFQTTR
ncbi:MAG: zf-HC2 domain-containing protein [Bryobacteraceae bacterium]